MIDFWTFDATHLLSEPIVCETYRRAPVRKTFDGTASHSTTRANNARQVAGYGKAPVRKAFGRAPVGAGHARDQVTRGHGPLLQVSTFFGLINCQGDLQ